MSPAAWRAFIKPRLKKLFLPAVKAGLDIHFHSCGQIGAVLGDLKEIGVTSVWLQLPAYDMEELAARCRALGLAAAIHTDRANTMTYSTPRDVRELVLREYEAFRMAEGGAWFYIEADNGLMPCSYLLPLKLRFYPPSLYPRSRLSYVEESCR